MAHQRESISFLVCFVAMGAGMAFGQHVKQVDDGQRLFQKSCTGCHGQNAKGGRGSDLTGKLQHGSLDSEVARNIISGIPGTQMPPFAMPETDARAIVAYLGSLREGGPDLPMTGNAANGQQLFFGDAGCSRCHMYKGVGGRLGPDLSAAEGKTVRELRRVISEPHKELAHGFESVEVRFADGRTLRGVRKNEDTFSLQMMDEHEKLHLLLKKDVAEVRLTRKSMMPVAAVSGERVDDVIAFLKTAPPVQQGAWNPSPDLNVTFQRLKAADEEPRNWLSYWGNLMGTHYSNLGSITTANVGALGSAWTYQFGVTKVETTPLVVDGIMFATSPSSTAALDARTGRSIWKYNRRLPSDVHSNCTVMTNRGVAILGDRVYMATLDAHLVALDAKTGNVIWDVPVEDYKTGVSITHAPLAIDGKIIVGITAGECALVGFVDGYDAATGKKLWRFNSMPEKGDPARKTWAGKSVETGGGPTWMTGTYDPRTDTVFWATGNPSPDYDGSVRAGDNLYTCSVLAIDPNTGKLKWHFQFTPHDTHDWDATETPVLADAEINGKMRHLLMHADRNALFYLLDRDTGEFLLGKPFAKQTWTTGFDPHGRPIVIPGTDPTPEGVYVCPDAAGATNWASPSWDPVTKLLYISARDSCATYTSKTKVPTPGMPYVGSGQKDDSGQFPGAIRAIDPTTGDVRWSFDIYQGSWSAGVLSTAGGVLFASSKDGNLIALDAHDGKELWHYQTGGEILSSPISYSVDGRQYVAVSTDSSLVTFAIKP